LKQLYGQNLQISECRLRESRPYHIMQSKMQLNTKKKLFRLRETSHIALTWPLSAPRNQRISTVW